MTTMTRSMMPLTLLVCLGCTGAPGSVGAPEKYPVFPASGQLTHDRKPLAAATVSFIASDGRATASAVTDAEGAFVLSTYGRGDGAPAGKFKVLVAIDDVDMLPGGIPNPKVRKSPTGKRLAQYSTLQSTPLVAEITEGGMNRFTFDLK